MNRIREVIKRKVKDYHLRRVYGERQVKCFVMITCLLIGLGLFVEFGYYSTIGYLGQEIALEILKVHLLKLGMILSYAYVIDLIASFIVKTNPKTIKEAALFPLKRPAFLFTNLLILMLSLDAPISVFCIASTVMTIFSQNTKNGHTFYRIHPILIGYLIGGFGIIITNQNLGLVELPPMLSAPYMEVMNAIPSLTYDQFITTFYSLPTVVFGIFEGNLCSTLIIPILVCGLFLMKRQVIDYKTSLLYIGTYVLLGLLLGLIIKQPLWIIILFLLNGSVLLTGIFLITDVVTLERYKSFKYLYILAVALLTIILSYYVHFVFAPYLALGIIQVLTLLIDFGHE